MTLATSKKIYSKEVSKVESQLTAIDTIQNAASYDFSNIKNDEMKLFVAIFQVIAIIGCLIAKEKLYNYLEKIGRQLGIIKGHVSDQQGI